MEQQTTRAIEREVSIPAGKARLAGNLAIPEGATGIVLFAHGSGSSRHSSRNVFVARALQSAGLGTLLFDLLTRAEEEVDVYTREHRFDIGLLAERLEHATHWIIVGGSDDVVIGLNERAYARLTCEKEMSIVPGASHLFEEPGTLEAVAELAMDWFGRRLGAPR